MAVKVMAQGRRPGLATPPAAASAVVVHPMELGLDVGTASAGQWGVGATVIHGEVSAADVDGLHGG